MLRTRLLTATAAVALFAAGSAFAQTAPTAPVGPAATPPVAAEEPIEAPAAAAAQAATSAAAPTQTAAVVENNVVDVLRANGQFTTLLAALDAAQLIETLSTQAAISIFAPTDAAFAALPEADRTRLMDPANVNELRQVLLYHVVVADVNSSQIEGARGGVQTAATTEVQLDGTGDAIKVDNATVTTADIDAGNGSIFIIDRVLNPADSLVATGDAEAATAPAAAPAAEDADAATPPADDTVDEVTPPAATTTTTRPATGVNAPSGQPAATTTTVASPTVPNPTDGQVDDEDADDAPAPTPAPRPQS
ncbi:fasciclin domain-containing protein [Brevundimonas sp. TWP2-3-2]|uniref:fasciclin domain-containing protein n=1 Tax=unclassified Brevundimonas TaxID=2622653 RepID=UPI003CE8DD1E